MHQFLLHNGRLCGTADKLVSPGQVGYMNGWGIFSTLRVCDGVLFAYERHYQRLKHDSERMHVPFPWSSAELEQELQKLVHANSARNATLRVCVVRNFGGLFEGAGVAHDSDLVAFTSDLNAWGSGVSLGYVPHARLGSSEFAGAKITSWIENLVRNERAKQCGLDEVILLNEHGHVSECTSANIFAIQGNRILTPPLSTSGCLPGVTRALLLEEIRVLGVRVEEGTLTPESLEASDGSFITSTTRDLLAIHSIEGRVMRQSPEVIEKFQLAFAAWREAYVRRQMNAREEQPVH